MPRITQRDWVRLKANIYMVLRGFPDICQRPSSPCHDMNNQRGRQDLPQRQSDHERPLGTEVMPTSSDVLPPGPSTLSFLDVQTAWLPENRGQKRGFYWPTPSGFYSRFAIRLGLLLLAIRLIPYRVLYMLKRRNPGRPSSPPHSVCR